MLYGKQVFWCSCKLILGVYYTTVLVYVYMCSKCSNCTVSIAGMLLLYVAMPGTFVSIHGQQINCSLLKWNVG